MNHVNAGFGDHLPGKVIGIALSENNPFDAGVDQHFGADHARHGGAVESRTINNDAVAGGLDDGILFSVQPAAELVTLSRWHVQLRTQTAGLFTVADAGRDSVVAGGQDVAVLDQNGADTPAQTGGAGGYQSGDIDKILVPGGALHMSSIPSPCVLKKAVHHRDSAGSRRCFQWYSQGALPYSRIHELQGQITPLLRSGQHAIGTMQSRLIW